MHVSAKTWLKIIAITLAFTHIQAVHANKTLGLEEAVAIAQSANPALAAIEARRETLQQLAHQQSALPEPSLSINTLNIPLDSFSLSQEPMTQLQVRIDQTLPYPGKLALASQAATHQAQAAHYDYQQQRLLLTRDVKTLWWNLFYLDQALAAVKQNQILYEQVINIAETRYQVGQGSQQDILLAQLEHSKLHDQSLRLQQMRKNEAIRLNVLLDQEANSPIELPPLQDKQLPNLDDINTFQEQALKSQPSLFAQQQRIEHARTQIELAKKEYSPDFKLGAAYGLRFGDNTDGSDRADFGSIFFTVNLPLYTDKRQDRLLDQRNAQWLQQKYALSDLRNTVLSNVNQAINDFSSLKQQTELFNHEIIPHAKQTVDVMLAGYQVGKVDFLSLAQSQTTLYNYETQRWKTFSAAQQALARLSAALGEE